MDIKITLADAAQVDSDNKLSALGLGWTFTTTPTPPMAVVLLVDVEWTEANQPFRILGELIDADGKTVMAPGPIGPEPVSFTGEFETGRPPGTPRGTPYRLPVALTVGPGLPLKVGQRYTWRVTVEGLDNAWSESFLVTGDAPDSGEAES